MFLKTSVKRTFLQDILNSILDYRFDWRKIKIDIIIHRVNNKQKTVGGIKLYLRVKSSKWGFIVSWKITFEIKKLMQDPDNTGNKMQLSVLFTNNSLFCFQVETNKTIVLYATYQAKRKLHDGCCWNDMKLYIKSNISKVQFVKCSQHLKVCASRNIGGSVSQ